MDKIEQEYNKLWDLLVDNNIATEQELELVSDINGWSVKTLNDILYVRTGYRDFEQFKECELDEN